MNRRPVKYVESFWNTDLFSSEGFDALRVRMKDGRKLCKDIEEYFRQRAKIEAQYAKDLQKLAKTSTPEFKDEGILERAWKEMKLQTEQIATAHDNAGTDFSRLATEIYAFNDEQRHQTKTVEEKVIKSHNTAKTSHQKCTNAHRTYQQKCRDWESARDALSNAEKTVASITPKEMEKIRNKHNKCKDEMEKSDLLYKSSIEELRTNKRNWEGEHVDGCNVLQDLDEKRIDQLRDSLWKCTNVDSQSCVDHDECCEKVRMSLEMCNVNNETEMFVQSKSTGNVRPASLVYESFFEPCNNDKPSSLSRRPAMMPPRGGVPILGALPTDKHSGFSTYAEIESIESIKMKVVKRYKSKSYEELNVVVGEIVSCIGDIQSNGMVEVELERTGDIGFVPMKISMVLMITVNVHGLSAKIL